MSLLWDVLAPFLKPRVVRWRDAKFNSDEVELRVCVIAELD